MGPRGSQRLWETSDRVTLVGVSSLSIVKQRDRDLRPGSLIAFTLVVAAKQGPQFHSELLLLKLDNLCLPFPLLWTLSCSIRRAQGSILALEPSVWKRKNCFVVHVVHKDEPGLPEAWPGPHK